MSGNPGDETAGSAALACALGWRGKRASPNERRLSAVFVAGGTGTASTLANWGRSDSRAASA